MARISSDPNAKTGRGSPRNLIRIQNPNQDANRADLIGSKRQNGTRIAADLVWIQNPNQDANRADLIGSKRQNGTRIARIFK